LAGRLGQNIPTCRDRSQSNAQTAKPYANGRASKQHKCNNIQNLRKLQQKQHKAMQKQQTPMYTNESTTKTMSATTKECNINQTIWVLAR